MWNIGGGIIYHEDLLWLIKTLRKNYGLDRLISAVHDSHQGMIFNGGRVLVRPHDVTKEKAAGIIHRFNDLGVSFYLTFNNPLIREEHLDDPRSNFLLAAAQNELNGVIVASEALYHHVKKNYPKYALIASCVPNEKSLKYYRRMMKLYDLVVLAPDLNTDHHFIGKLDPDRLEVLVNEECLTGCPHRRLHYDLLARANLTHDWDIIEETYNFCIKSHGYDKSEKEASALMAISPGEVEALKRLGVKRFKIQGRTEPTGEKMRHAVRKYILDPENIYL